MTGGRTVESGLSVGAMVRQALLEGAKRVVVVAEDPNVDPANRCRRGAKSSTAHKWRTCSGEERIHRPRQTQGEGARVALRRRIAAPTDECRLGARVPFHVQTRRGTALPELAPGASARQIDTADYPVVETFSPAKLRGTTS
jgi:hypothetical protein